MADRGGTATLVVGIAVVTLGVLEVTAREHFSGYRSHATLLAAIPAVALGIGVVSLAGTDRQDRAPVLLAVAVPVFAFLFWLLRKRFQIARQARVARPPAAEAPARGELPGRAWRPERRLEIVGLVEVVVLEGRRRRQPEHEDRAAVGGVLGRHEPPCCVATCRTIARPRPLPWLPREFAPR